MLVPKLKIVNQETSKEFINFLKSKGVNYTLEHHTDLGYDVFEWDTVTVHDDISFNEKWNDKTYTLEYSLSFYTDNGLTDTIIVDADCRFIREL